MLNRTILETLSAVQDHPGLSDTALGQMLGIGQAAMNIRLRWLAANGYVQRSTKNLPYTTSLTKAGRQFLAKPQRDTRDEVAATLQEQPHISRRELAQHLGISPTTAQHHMRRLQAR